MSAILATLLRISAGLGLGYIIDKFIPDPKPPAPVPIYKTGLSAWNPLKILVLAVIITIGGMVLLFVGKKLNIKLLKK